MLPDAPPGLGPPKGLPPDTPTNLDRVDELGWTLFASGFHLPLAVLHEPAVRHNSATMAAYCARHGVSLAPHGKTTMAPELFRIQLDDGAWAITAATVWQARTMLAAGVPRVLIANEVVTAPEIRWLGQTLEDGRGPDVSCYVDSVAGVELLERTLAEDPPARPLPVLVELGIPGGRTGARSIDEAVKVASAVQGSRHLVARGTAGFEGIITDRDGRSAHDLVKEYLRDLHALTVAVHDAGGFDDTDEVVVSAGGSAFFDHVVAEFGRIELAGRRVRPVLRSGCYLTHADGGYELSSPMGSNPRLDPEEGRFRAAMEVWGAVLSRPEATRAIVGVGKRDVSPDGDPPRVRGVRRSDGEEVDTVASVVGMNDQHAYLDVAASSPLAIGDLIALGVRHPCTTFDKWRAIPMVDDAYRVRRIVRTYF